MVLHASRGREALVGKVHSGSGASAGGGRPTVATEFAPETVPHKFPSGSGGFVAGRKVAVVANYLDI